MRNYILFFFLCLLMACGNAFSDANVSKNKKTELMVLDEESKLPTACSALDFLKLQEKELQMSFFSQLDSILKVQYPNNDKETEIMVDITPDYLERFLLDISADSLLLNNEFEKAYHFNRAPKGYSDPVFCKDIIAIYYDEKGCYFRMSVYNTFLVEPDWCTESTVIYAFSINENSIKGFRRTEAG